MHRPSPIGEEPDRRPVHNFFTGPLHVGLRHESPHFDLTYSITLRIINCMDPMPQYKVSRILTIAHDMTLAFQAVFLKPTIPIAVILLNSA